MTALFLAAFVAAAVMSFTLVATAGPRQHVTDAGVARSTNEAVRVPCATVISRINHEVGAVKGHSADMSIVAKRLGTSVSWVEQCMLSYGRRPKRPGLETSEAREERLERLEEDEPEEVAPEDVQEPGAREREEHPEKERVGRLKAPPTPADFKLERGQ